MFCFNRWMVCVVCTFAGSLAYPATDAALQQCRSDQTGDIAIANCLSLQHEETEVALAGIEESFGNLLGTTYRNDSIGGSLTEFWAQSKAPAEAKSGKTGRQVIAIIDGVATSVDESVLSDDDATPLTKPADAPEPDPLVSFDAERAQFRAYRDNRCSWIARVFEPAETAWREISCRVGMNRSRIDDLRAQLKRRQEQKKRGYAVRGFLQRMQFGLSFQPCGSTRKWPVSADGELFRALEDRLQAVSADSNPVVYAELFGSRLRSGSGAGLAATGITQLRAAVAGDCELDTSASTLSVSQVLPADRQLPLSAEIVPEVEEQKPIVASEPSVEKSAQTESSSPSLETVQATEPADSASASAAGPGTLANASDDLMYGYFQGWAAACETSGKRVCRAFSDSEPTAENTWQLQIHPASDGQYEIVLLPRTQNVRIGRDVGIYVDQKPVADRRLSPAETRLKVSDGVVLKRAENAQSLLRELRRGTSLLLRWVDYSDVQTDVKFTLWGLSRALEFAPEP